MALFAALLYYDRDRYWSEDTEREHLGDYGTFGDAAAAAGVLRGGQALEPPITASTVIVGEGGATTITDGPFAETKEVLGGLILLDVADLEEAQRWAARIPAARRGKVEVRPAIAMDRDDLPG